MEESKLSIKEERLLALQNQNPTELLAIATEHKTGSFAMKGLGMLIGFFLTFGGTAGLYFYLTIIEGITDWILLIVYLLIGFLGLLVISAFLTYMIRKSAWRNNPCYSDNGVLLNQCNIK